MEPFNIEQSGGAVLVLRSVSTSDFSSQVYCDHQRLRTDDPDFSEVMNHNQSGAEVLDFSDLVAVSAEVLTALGTEDVCLSPRGAIQTGVCYGAGTSGKGCIWARVRVKGTGERKALSEEPHPTSRRHRRRRLP
ncbi:hypothetical protein SKAU_G00301940 [Synaphobranchus kaupii]|uniref:Uncharacterized protein n=1 Tax=Synaphobranchus kaupii TaxID=118154 RepID=A0A9Q1INE1_SYNKA|nr:hypothetical protein SKAU_G00301940 [Synaphobranchus kaupii]